MQNPQNILIIGGGQAGGQLLRRLVAQEDALRITLATAEDQPPYERPPLSKGFLKGEVDFDALRIVSADELADPRVTTHFGETLQSVDPEKKTATFASGLVLGYDKLVLALGARGRKLPIAGAEHCVELRDLDDSKILRAKLEDAAHITIIGGGVIGLEVAATARLLGKAVCILEAGPAVMGRILPPDVSHWLQSRHEAEGVRILTHAAIQKINAAEQGFTAEIRHADGSIETLRSDILLSAIGVVPNVEVLPASCRGLSGGISTDETGKVIGVDDIYAIGDMAECFNGLYGRPLRLETWRNADSHGEALAQTLRGTPQPHVETPWMWSDQYDVNLQAVGLWQEGCQIVQRGEIGAAGSTTFWLLDGRVMGGVLINNGKDRRFLEKMLVTGARPDPALLADPNTPMKSIK